MTYSIAQQLANRNPNFWSGEKVEQKYETVKVEAWLNFNADTAVLTRVESLNDNSRPASVKSDILYGHFEIDQGIFKGGTVERVAEVTAEPARGYKDQRWTLFELNSPFKIEQSIEPFNVNNSWNKSNEVFSLHQMKENPAFTPGFQEKWETIYTDRRISDTTTYPDEYNNWQDAKDKLIEWGFEDPFLDEFYGYTNDFKEVDIYNTIKNTSGIDEDNTPGNEAKFLEPITSSLKFNKKSADKITNFNPSTDTLEIDTDSFGINSSATFASGKNKKKVKKKLAKQDIDFLYDQKKGGLYFNENGADKGFGDGGIIAILKGAPDLTSGNLEFI